jgi:glycosyltransferase involved in cell wall biosynthesis
VLDVIMPFYGDPALLRLAVQSVREQTSAAWRLVVVDDAYPDEGVAAWFESLADDRVAYHRNPRNLGVNANFQHCLQLARAPHVVLMGCDDVMRPSYVETVLAAAGACDAAMIQPAVQVIDSRGDPASGLVDRVKRRLTPDVNGRRALDGETLAVSLLRGAWTYFPAICWRTDVVQRIGFRRGLDTSLDLGLILDVLLDGQQLLLLDEVAFCYRRHDSSASNVVNDDRRFAEEAHFFALFAEILDSAGWPAAARAARRHWTSRLHALAQLPATVRSRDLPRARRLAAHAVR